MSDPLPSDGARLLRLYLAKTQQSVPVFCEIHGFDRVQVQRYLRGERARISVDFAYGVEHATSGQVPWYSWRSETRRPAERMTGASSERKPRRSRRVAA
jgi:hypothetical protein